MAIAGSWRDTLGDEEVLRLREYMRPAKYSTGHSEASDGGLGTGYNKLANTRIGGHQCR